MSTEQELVSIPKASLRILLAESMRLWEIYRFASRFVVDATGPNRLHQGSINWGSIEHNQAVQAATDVLNQADEKANVPEEEGMWSQATLTGSKVAS
jgi:hypothetical protein